MILKFDREKLETILCDFSRITGISIAFVDSELDYVASSDGKGTRFCRLLQASDNSYHCRCSDESILQRCKDSGKLEIHVCHAGFSDAAIPIVSGGEVIAYIILGRMGSGISFEECMAKLPWYSGDREELKKEFSQTCSFNEEGIRSIANVAVAVASYILNDGVVKPQYNIVAERAAELISENLQKDITVGYICKSLGVSKNLLYDTFKAAFGCTVKEYVNNKRISRAVKMLCETDMQISEIADSVGISNHTYFSRLMTERLGMSPVKYRKTLLLRET